MNMGKRFWLMAAAYVLCGALFWGGVAYFVVQSWHWLETNGAKTLWEGKK